MVKRTIVKVKKHLRKGKRVKKHTRKVKIQKVKARSKKNFAGVFFPAKATLEEATDGRKGIVSDPEFNLFRDSAIGATREDPKKVSELTKNLKKSFSNGFSRNRVFGELSNNEKEMRLNAKKINKLGENFIDVIKRDNLLRRNNLLTDKNTRLMDLMEGS